MSGRLLKLLPGTFAIARLAADALLPAWAGKPSFLSVTRTADELSIVCEEHHVPNDVRHDRGWRCLRVAGPLDLRLTGVLASLLQPLADAGVSIFALSTFDTDYLLVRSAQLERALDALGAAGHRVESARAASEFSAHSKP